MNSDQSVIISRDFQSIFTGAVRYEIPFFQRGYAWTRDEWSNQRDLPFARYVLEQLDQRLQAHGEMPDYTTINTIEHVMPQTLDEDWKLDLGPAEANDVNLPRLRHTLGNLGLNSQSANSTYGNKSFATKKTQYAHPKSALTAAILAHPGPWNSAAIQDNSRQLAGTAQQIWAWTPPLIH